MSAGDAARLTRLGRYELITRIGQGGMAEVQLALQRGPAGFEKLVVVKLVHTNLASQKAFVDMLLDEARVAALVKHPNVVDIYDLGQAEGRFFIAMEYLEGEPLLSVLRAGREGKRLDPLSTGRLIADTAEGLDAAHELRSMSGERLELVHHDISLGNIVVLYNGQVKLVDFGVAKATTAAAAKGKVQGKFSYMAPEKLKGAQGDRRSDIFSLGCVMWEALTLKRLFRGGNDTETMKQVLEATILLPSKVNGDVPPELDPIVMRALERDPAKRHPTAKEMAVEIEEVLRKRGYGAKNDKIAKYMQETFKGHIDARKQLVQEVVSKGSASAAVLEEAFSDSGLASGSPVPVATGSDFSLKHRLTPASGVPTVGNAWADSSKPTQISAPPVMDEPEPKEKRKLPPPPARSSGVSAKGAGGGVAPAPAPASKPMRAITATEVDAAPLTEAPAQGSARATTADIAPTAEGTPAHEVSIDTTAADTTTATPVPTGIKAVIQAILADKKKRLYVAAGAGVLLLILIIVIASGGGDDKKQPAVADGSGSAAAGDVRDDIEEDAAVAAVEPVEIDAAVEPAAVVDAAVEDIVIDPQRGSSSGSGIKGRDPIVRPPPPPPPPPPALDVEDTVAKALQSFVKGDAKGALGLLQKAKAAKPGYAPTYRVLGRVYKKLGDNANAKKAFQKFLQLSPTAQDAAQIRDEITKL